MPRTFTKMTALEEYVEKACEKAVRNACNRLLGVLQEMIDTEYYDQFEPEVYKRTYQFWEAATSEMVTKTCGKIFMDEGTMNYNGYWNGKKQLFYANQGYHGGKEIKTDGMFWKSFVHYCNSNAESILKEELGLQGINAK